TGISGVIKAPTLSYPGSTVRPAVKPAPTAATNAAPVKTVATSGVRTAADLTGAQQIQRVEQPRSSVQEKDIKIPEFLRNSKK
ncbi:MAG: hypothetical protein K5840_05600, partial [Eubacterium sp.]|nr:hypothetical protein [Eubacterium sp.]